MYISVAYRCDVGIQGLETNWKRENCDWQGMEGAIGEDGDSEKVGINWARINWREGKEKRKNVSGEEDRKMKEMGIIGMR